MNNYEDAKGEALICSAVHVRPLRGLSTLLALTPGRSVPGGRATRRPPVPETTWGHSWCDPSGVSTNQCTYRATPPRVSALTMYFATCPPLGSVLIQKALDQGLYPTQQIS